MELIKPNKTTKAAVGHPLVYSLVTALVCAAIAAGGGASSGAASSIFGGIGAFVVIFLLSYWLWRPTGPGGRWYQRRTSGDRATAK